MTSTRQISAPARKPTRSTFPTQWAKAEWTRPSRRRPRSGGSPAKSTASPPCEAHFTPRSVGGAAGSAGRRTRRPSIRRRGGQLGSSAPARQEHADVRRFRTCRDNLPDKARGPWRWAARQWAAGGHARQNRGGAGPTRPRSRDPLNGRISATGACNVQPTGKTIRLRDKDHLKFVSKQACVVCGRTPSDAHHLRFAQPRALGRKVSDESRYRFAAFIIASFTGTVTRRRGGRVSRSTPCRLQSRFGDARAAMERLAARLADAP
jgi:hypothetical protein